MTKLVKMERDGLQADVHPDEVENYAAAGYVAAPKAKSKQSERKA